MKILTIICLTLISLSLIGASIYMCKIMSPFWGWFLIAGFLSAGGIVEVAEKVK